MSNIFFNLTKIWWKSYRKCGTHTHTPHHMQKKVKKKKKAKGTVSVTYCLYNKPLSKLSGLRQQLFSVCVLSHCGCIQLFLTPWTISHQAPLSMDFPDKNTGECCHFLLHRIFPTQGLNPHLLHCRWILLPLTHWGSPLVHSYVAQPFRLESVGQFSDTHLRSFMWPACSMWMLKKCWLLSLLLI